MRNEREEAPRLHLQLTFDSFVQQALVPQEWACKNCKPGMQSPPKDRPYSGSGGQGDGSAFRVRHLYKGIILGVIIGVVYCLITQDIVAQAGAPVNCPGYGGPELTAGNSSKHRYRSAPGELSSGEMLRKLPAQG